MSAKLQISPALKQTSQADKPTRFYFALAGILVIAALAYLSMAFNWPKFSRAEVFFAECVREMFQTDNLVTPLYHGTPFFDKPILAYWFIAAVYKVVGISHFAARIPAVIFALLTVTLTAFAGKHLFGARQGILAAAVLASSPMFMSFANLCMSDMNLVFFDTATLSLLYLSLLQAKNRSICLYVAALSMGLAFLTKGPVGIVLPVVFFAIYLSLSKQWSKIRLWKDVLPCILILLGAGVPWFMAAFRQNGAGALGWFFIHENLERFAGSTYDVHHPAWFMITSLLGGMLPWSIFIPVAVFDSFKVISARTQQNVTFLASSLGQKHVYVWLWLAVVVGFFSISRGKIDYYILPAYPAAAILIGNLIVDQSDKQSKALGICAWTLSILLLGLGAASAVVLPNIFAKEGIAGWPIIPSILLGSAILMLAYCRKSEMLKTYMSLFASVSLLSIVLAWQIYPWITSKQAVLTYIPYIRNLEGQARIGVYTSLHNWIDEITFQTDREPLRIEKIKMAELFMQAKSPSLLLIQEGEYAQMSPQSRLNCHVVERSPFIPRSLNPMYFMSKGQKLADNSNLLLVTNRRLARDIEDENERP